MCVEGIGQTVLLNIVICFTSKCCHWAWPLLASSSSLPICFLWLSRLTVSPSSITRVLRDADGLEALREQVTDSTDAAAAAATGAVTETAEPAATPAADTVGGATGLQEHRVKTVS